MCSLCTQKAPVQLNFHPFQVVLTGCVTVPLLSRDSRLRANAWHFLLQITCVCVCNNKVQRSLCNYVEFPASLLIFCWLREKGGSFCVLTSVFPSSKAGADSWLLQLFPSRMPTPFSLFSPLPFPDSLCQASRVCKDDQCVSAGAIVTRSNYLN